MIDWIVTKDSKKCEVYTKNDWIIAKHSKKCEDYTKNHPV
jgi:hypothetical protein